MHAAARHFALASGIVCIALSLRGLAPAQAQSDAASRPEFYTTRVKPIFDANCARCHGGFNHRGGLNMDSRAGFIKGGHFGAAIVPGDPDHSLLLRLIRHEGPVSDPGPMSPNRPKISDAEIQTVMEWIRAGAIMPADVPKP